MPKNAPKRRPVSIGTFKLPERQIKKTFRDETSFDIATQTQHMTKAATKQKPAPFARVFLLSPARLGGSRTEMLLREDASFETAVKLREGKASIGEIYAFISGLYFRGKVAYTEAFGNPPEGVPRAVVIVPGFGLIPLHSALGPEHLKKIGLTPIDQDNDAYKFPLLRDAALLKTTSSPETRFVLLGSIASDKYIGPLLSVFGERLLFPQDFVGRGDMSRGGLMLRSAREGEELSYVPVQGASRHGKRVPKLEPWRKR